MDTPWGKAIDSVSGLISEFITDDDLRAKLDVEMAKIKSGVITQLLNTTTTPKTDAFVKILIAFRDIIIPMLRPLGAGCMTAFGMYCHYKGISLDGATQVVMDGAFPAWGASRHVNKTTEIKKKNIGSGRKNYGDWDDDD